MRMHARAPYGALKSHFEVNPVPSIAALGFYPHDLGLQKARSGGSVLKCRKKVRLLVPASLHVVWPVPGVTMQGRYCGSNLA